MLTKTYKPMDSLIEKSGLKYDKIAERMGISTNYLYKMRANPRRMDVDHIEELSKVLDLDFMSVYEIVKKFKSEVDKMAS